MDFPERTVAFCFFTKKKKKTQVDLTGYFLTRNLLGLWRVWLLSARRAAIKCQGPGFYFFYPVYFQVFQGDKWSSC